MASIAIMIGGAILNATAFIGGSYLAKAMGGGDAEKKRHDLALEKYQTDYGAWQKKERNYQDWLSQRYQNKMIADRNFANTDAAFKLYAQAHPDKKFDFVKPNFKNYYTPSKKQTNAELIYVGAGGLILGGVAAYYI